MIIKNTNIGNNIDLDDLKKEANEFDYIPVIPTIKTENVVDFLKDNPNYTLYDGDNTFLINLNNNIKQLITSDKIKTFGNNLIKENLDKEWCVLERVDFVEAIRSWDRGYHILRRTDDLFPCLTFIQDGKLNRDDIQLDLIDVLVRVWFRYANL